MYPQRTPKGKSHRCLKQPSFSLPPRPLLPCNAKSPGKDNNELRWALRSCCWKEAAEIMQAGRYRYADLDPEDMEAIESLRRHSGQ